MERPRKENLRWSGKQRERIEGKGVWGMFSSTPAWRGCVGEGWSHYAVHGRTDISLHIYRVPVEIVFLRLCQLSNSAPEGRRLFSASVLKLWINTLKVRTVSYLSPIETEKCFHLWKLHVVPWHQMRLSIQGGKEKKLKPEQKEMLISWISLPIRFP